MIPMKFPCSQALSLLLFLVAACFPQHPTQAGTIVQFRTAIGEVEVELYDDEKPITTTNFLRYVVDGAFTNTFMHRAVRNFVFQGGGFGVRNLGQTNEELFAIETRAAITNEFNVGPFRSNVRGTLAMAKGSSPNSATSQFFFNLTNNSVALDNPANSGGFTVFGRVIGSEATLDAWNSFQPLFTNNPPAGFTNLIVNLSGGNPFSPFREVPLYNLATATNGSRFASLSDLVFVDVTLLRVKVTRTPDGQAEIRWNRLAGRTNTVEFTTGFPPVWEILTNLPPDALGDPRVTDPTADTNRFYRVRATY